MNRILYLFLFILIIDLFFYRCANPASPTGGPQDTIPPILIISSPISGTINFSESELTLQFSKDINADKLKQQLIITPITDLRYTFLVKQNKLIIKLKGELQDSITYNFNFVDGVTSITEKKPVINLSLAFSTGPSIDSMSIQGSVQELLTQKPGSSYITGLYPYSDTLDYFLEKPLYFTSANDSGDFKLEYIKKGVYKILAFNDINKNFLLDPETESHGFLEDKLMLNSALIIPTLRCVLQDIRPIKLINVRSVAPYAEIKYNKIIDSYKIDPPNFHHNLVGKHSDVIRIYKQDNILYKDSITAVISVKDTLLNSVHDTVNFVFLESNRKPTSFSYSFNVKNVILTDDTTTLVLNFNKPIVHTDASKIYFIADSTFKYLFQKRIIWNTNKTKATLQFSVNKDSLLSSYIKSLPSDTIQTDSSDQSIHKPRLSSISLALDTTAFISVENDTSTFKSIRINDFSKKSTSTLKINLITNHTNFTVQLIDRSNIIHYQSHNNKTVIFTSIKTGSYRIRILIDENKDGIWSYGNLLKNKTPEQLFLYDDEVSIRENWVIDLDILF